MDAPLPPQISPSNPATDASALASLAVDAAGAAIPSVDGAASVAAFDGTTPADDSRAPTAPQTDAAEGTLSAVASSAASAEAAIPSAEAGALAAPQILLRGPACACACVTGVSKSQVEHVGSSGLSEWGTAEVAIAALMLSFADKTVNAPG